ncbi:MAG TPA: DUF4258 domain-containing protein [Armatimonadetes bacterium]|nr:DUF4258 domain-containing protein [Armatimonadota bacterium]
MSQPPGIRFIRSHVRAKRYRLTKHATIVRIERGITIAEIEPALLNGEIIERYPDAQPYPSCLVLDWLASGDPLHIVCSRGDVEPALRIVTLYEPEDALWESDYKTRKVRK